MIACALAAAVGGIARVCLDAAINRGVLGIAVVNCLGSFLIGVLSALPADLFLIFGVGLCGSFTTFSTAVLDAVSLLRDRRYGAAAALCISTLALCLLACAAGLAIVS